MQISILVGKELSDLDIWLGLHATILSCRSNSKIRKFLLPSSEDETYSDSKLNSSSVAYMKGNAQWEMLELYLVSNFFCSSGIWFFLLLFCYLIWFVHFYCQFTRYSVLVVRLLAQMFLGLFSSFHLLYFWGMVGYIGIWIWLHTLFHKS